MPIIFLTSPVEFTFSFCKFVYKIIPHIGLDSSHPLQFIMGWDLTYLFTALEKNKDFSVLKTHTQISEKIKPRLTHTNKHCLDQACGLICMQATSKPTSSSPAAYEWLKRTKTTPTATPLTLNNKIMSSDTSPIFVPIFIGSLGVLKHKKAMISPAEYPDSKALP